MLLLIRDTRKSLQDALQLSESPRIGGYSAEIARQKAWAPQDEHVRLSLDESTLCYQPT